MPFGRPTALNDVKRSEICALISAGLTQQEAARYVGCDARTIRREERRNPEFRRAVRDAELRARLDPERLMRQAAASHWRAAAWLLERSDPKRYARRAPETWSPEDVDELCARLIETALAEIDHPTARRRAYERLTAVAEEARQHVGPRAARPARRPTTVTPLSDFQQLDGYLQEMGQAYNFDPPPNPAPSGADKSLPTCVPPTSAGHPRYPASQSRQSGQKG